MRVVLTLIVAVSLLLPLPAGACALFYGVAGGARVDKGRCLNYLGPRYGHTTLHSQGGFFCAC